MIFDFLFQSLFHSDDVLVSFIDIYGAWTYFLLFLIIFVETGLVVMPFLPGDSLIFVAGTLAAAGSLNFFILLFCLAAAAILGDSLNYGIGSFIGPRAFTKDQGFFFRKDHLEKARVFYEKHGAKTIIIARFMPFVRTFTPFVAGIGRMNYSKFLIYNIIGGILWVGLFLIAGFLFGNIPIVKENITLFALIIVFLSILPGIIKFLLREK